MVLRNGTGCVSNSGMLSVFHSTITNCNFAGSASIINNHTMTLTNTTVAGDGIGTGQIGGAITNFGTATLIHTTVTGHDAGTGGATGGILTFSTLNLENSIVAGNRGIRRDLLSLSGGTVNATGANLIGDNSTVEAIFPAGPLVGTAAAPLNAALNRLGDNGGATPTMVPAATSPAIDAAMTTVDSPMIDQRGVLRPEGNASDLGPVERRSSDVDPDTDGDGVIDALDTDDDNDGVPNESDEFPLGRFDNARPGDFAFSFIEALARAGITGGCTAVNFCPGDPVTRAQMAVFLVRTFGL